MSTSSAALPASGGPWAAAMSTDHRSGSRRRGATLERAILLATLEELAEVGYARLTMERVATRARTGKAALYRRWGSRAELVVTACTSVRTNLVELPDTGALRSDVIALLNQLAAVANSWFGSTLRGLLAEMTRDSNFAGLVREHVLSGSPAALDTILRRAVERGEADPGVLGSRRATVATELLLNDFLLYGAPVPDEVAIEIVDEVYLPLVCRIPGTDEVNRS